MEVAKGPGVAGMVWSRRGEPGETSPSLVGALIAGDPARWAAFVAAFGPYVRRCARLSGLRAQDAEDVLQAVLLKVVTRARTFRRERPGATFRGWVWTIARHESIEKLRGEGQQPSVAGDLAWVPGVVLDGLDDSKGVAPNSAELELK